MIWRNLYSSYKEINVRQKLSQLANVRTGVFGKPGSAGDAVYLQAKHFNDLGEMVSAPPADLKIAGPVKRHLLNADDILFAAKGSKNFAAVYHGYFPAVASTTFFVLRLRDQSVLPEYLSWFLNSQATQALLKRQAIGSAMVSISKTVLEDLELSVPSIERQKQILAIARLSKTEHDLRLRIAELRQNQIQHQITNAIK